MCEKGFLKSSYLSETTEQLGWNVPCVIPLQSLYSFC
jgi:hypothetical protein